MIRVTIREAALRRELSNPAELSRSIGVSKPTAARLWAGTPPPELPTLGKICEAWNCPLTELVRWVPNGKLRKQKPNKK